MIDLAPNLNERAMIWDVVTGRTPADVLVRGGSVVDVYQEKLRADCSIALVGRRIVGTGRTAEGYVGDATRVIDCHGSVIIPGLIEPHTHASRLSLARTAELQVAAGVTTTILDPGDLAYVCGIDSIRHILHQTRTVPGRTFITIPPLMGLDSLHEEQLGPSEQWIQLLDEPGVVGIGESYWADLLRGHQRTTELIGAAISRGLAVEGHAAGAKPQIVSALAAIGIGSDHEAVSADDVEARLHAGMYVYARHGVTRRDLVGLAPTLMAYGGLDRIALCTDGVGPSDLAAGRSLNSVVELLLELGVPLCRAVRMATLVPAQRFGLAPWIGGLIPGALADIVVLPDEGHLRPQLVLVGGVPVTLAIPTPIPDWMLNTVRLPPIPDELLSRPQRGKWRAIQINSEAPFVTREVATDAGSTIVALAVDRLGTDRSFRGLIQGFGMHDAAVASTTGADSRVILALGDHPEDIRVAIEAVASMQGGAAVVSAGHVKAKWEARIGGQLSDAPPLTVSKAIDEVNEAMKQFGCPFPDPLLTIDFLTSPAVPHLRICCEGYVRIRDGARLGAEAP